MNVFVERLDEGTPIRATFALHMSALETMARQALFEPAFDLEVELANTTNRVYAAWDASSEEGAPVGFIVTAHIVDELHIHNVVVDPAARRCGAGRALVDASLSDARAAGLRLALLEVRRSNEAALGLYRSRGFVPVRIRRNYYAEPADDAVEMAAELAPGALAAFDIVSLT